MSDPAASPLVQGPGALHEHTRRLYMGLGTLLLLSSAGHLVMLLWAWLQSITTNTTLISPSQYWYIWIAFFGYDILVAIAIAIATAMNRDAAKRDQHIARTCASLIMNLAFSGTFFILFVTNAYRFDTYIASATDTTIYDPNTYINALVFSGRTLYVGYITFGLLYSITSVAFPLRLLSLAWIIVHYYLPRAYVDNYGVYWGRQPSSSTSPKPPAARSTRNNATPM